MILVAIVGIWLGVVAIAVGIDVGTAYLADKHRPRRPRLTKPRKISFRILQEVKKAVVVYHNLRKIELGLHMVSNREASVVRPKGAHRRLQVSS